MLQRFLLVWLVALCAVALAWPSFGLGFDPFAATSGSLKWMITVTMFAIGALLTAEEIRGVVERWPTVAGGTAVQFLTMPLLAYTLGRLANVSDDWLLGLILVGCVPGAMASNVLTLAAKGNVSYSVSLTTMATLLSPLVVPAVLFITLQRTNVDAGRIAKDAFRSLCFQVFLPVVLGHLLSRRSARFEQFSRRVAPIIANVVILWIIAVVVNKHHQTLTSLQSLPAVRLLSVLLLLNILGYASGLLGGRLMRLGESETRALTLEVGMQNAGLGAVLAVQLFPDNPEAGIPAALYTFGCMLTGTLLSQYWSRKPVELEHPAEPQADTVNADA